MHPGSGEISTHDKRLHAVSGFSKNFGIGVVTRDAAALWTDGRRFRQAVNEVDCGWQIYRKGGGNVTTVSDWILYKLSNLEGPKQVGSCPSYMNAVWWKNFQLILVSSNINMVPIDNDLVEQVWTEGRPLIQSKDINPLDIKFAGRSWQEKVNDVREEMKKHSADVLVLTGVDEIAWLFNIRGKEFLNRPYFYSLAIVERDSTSLYIIDSQSKLSRTPSDPETKIKLKDHLMTGTNGKCTGQCVQVHEYDIDKFVSDVSTIANKQDIENVWLSYDCNYKIYSAIPKNKIYQAITPTSYVKAKKNFIEREGMRNSNLLDSVEIIELFARLEKEVLEGVPWTVYSAMEEAIKVRRQSLSLYRDQSFNTVSGSGSRGADFGYQPTQETDHLITTFEIFNQDSGGQYLDGTSDLTRTFHYGTPSEHEKDRYTRVLMALINMAKLKFPIGKSGREIDAVARASLWEIGADYGHETGHGIGHNGVVVEGPAALSSVDATFMSDVKLDASLFRTGYPKLEKLPDWNDYPIDEHMCFTTEPGYYEVGKFGIRIENVMIVRKADKQGNEAFAGFLEFETVTLIPYEPHLIDYDQLSQSQVDWMNDYHKAVWEKVSPILQIKNNTFALDWLRKRVQPAFLRHNIHNILKETDIKTEL